jgi:ATP-dependent Clp protease protease subunit
LKIKERVNTLMAGHTGEPIKKVRQDTERDNFMSAEESKDYGLVDEVLDKRGK